MDRWRAFFGRADADLWTVIEQAIILAATDYPQEFMHKRCDIAETLFARRPLQALPGDTEATRLSGSVITNATCRVEEAPEVREEAENETEHTQRLCRDDVNRRDSHCDEAEGLDRELEEDVLVMKDVNRIKKTLMDCEQSEIIMLESLQKLERLRINVKILKATEIGKHVNNLRKHVSKHVQVTVKRLVRSWKDLVDEWVESSGHAPGNAIGASGGCSTLERANEEERLHSTPICEDGLLSARTTPSEMVQFQTSRGDELRPGDAHCQEDYHHAQNSRIVESEYCNYDLKPTMRNNDPELPEERGSSSRIELNGLSRIERIERKPQWNSRGPSNQIVNDHRDTGHSGRWLEMKSTTGGFGPGRPVTDTLQGIGSRTISGFGKLGNEVSKIQKDCDNPRTCDITGPGRPVTDISQVTGIGSRTISGFGKLGNEVSKIQDCDNPRGTGQKNRNTNILTDLKNSVGVNEVQQAERLEVAKRKLHEGYQQAENAKKQRTVQLVDLPDLPKAGPVRSKVGLPIQTVVASQSRHWSQNRR